jgi:hypothetical protein
MFDAQLKKQNYIHIPQSFDDDLISDKTEVMAGYISDQLFIMKSKL